MTTVNNIFAAVFEALATPHGVSHYLEQLSPVWSLDATSAVVQAVTRHPRRIASMTLVTPLCAAGEMRQVAAEMFAAGADAEVARVLARLEVEEGYATPKVDVRGAVFHAGKILLVQESADGRWAMPGGWADVGDAPAAMVAREIQEESGFDVVVKKVIALLDANRQPPLHFHHAYKAIFLCEISGGAARPSEETLAVDFFDFDALPPLSPFRTTAQHLQEVRAHLADPLRPAAFDQNPQG